MKNGCNKLFTAVAYILLMATAIQCNGIKNKSQMPDYSYKNAHIDPFYYSSEDLGDTPVLPLIKPYRLLFFNGKNVWALETGDVQNELGDMIAPLMKVNVVGEYIIGYKSFEKDNEDPTFNIPEKWFILNTESKQLSFFNTESLFKTALKKINQSEELLNPDTLFEQYKKDPVLPWFPDDVKKQMEVVRRKR